MLILERGDWLPREPQNWDATAVFVDNRYVSKDTWYDKDGEALPAAGALLRGRSHEALGAALYGCGSGLRGAAAPRRHLAGVAGRV